MKKDLYICDYPYVLFQAIIKSFGDCHNSELLFSNSFESMKPVFDVLSRSNLFSKCYYFEDKIFKSQLNKIMKFSADNCNSSSVFIKIFSLIKGFLLILKCDRVARRIILPVNITNDLYNVFYSDRMSTIMFYLNNKNIKYTAMQHGKNVWQLKPYSEILKMKVFELLEKLHIASGICCYTKACTAIEVTENKSINNIPKNKKIIEWNIDDAISKLTVEQKQQIFDIYAEAYDLHLDYSKNYNIILTNPLYADSFVSTEDKQVEFYKDLINKECEDIRYVIIKPHPRDKLDYSHYFPNCIVVDNSISAEILNFASELKISKAITLYSSSVNSYKNKAKKLINLEPNVVLAKDMRSLDSYR